MAATLAFQAMCHAAMSQNKIARGCKVVTWRNNQSTRPQSVRSHATCACIKRTSATIERNPLRAAKKFLSMNGGEFAFDGQFCGTEHKHDYEHEYQPSVAAATYGLASETRHN